MRFDYFLFIIYTFIIGYFFHILIFIIFILIHMSYFPIFIELKIFIPMIIQTSYLVLNKIYTLMRRR